MESRIGRRLSGRDTLIGSTPRRLRRRHGVELHGRAVAASGSSVQFADDSQLDVASVIWATGFRTDHSWIDAPVFDHAGRLEHRRGVTASPGLYFVGLSWQHTRGSALLGWVKDDAAYIARRSPLPGLAGNEGRPAADRCRDSGRVHVQLKFQERKMGIHSRSLPHRGRGLARGACA